MELRRALNLFTDKQQKSITDYTPCDVPQEFLMECRNTQYVAVNSRLAYFLDFIDTGGYGKKEKKRKKDPTHKKSPPHHTPHLLVSQPKRGCVGGRLAGNAVKETSVT